MSAASSTTDPAEDRAQDLLELASNSLEMGDVDGAKHLYKQSLEVKPSSTAWFNLGVCMRSAVTGDALSADRRQVCEYQLSACVWPIRN